MKHRLKLSASVLGGFLAVIAMSSSTASADQIHVEGTPVYVTGKQNATNTFGTTVGKIQCNSATYSGTVGATETSTITLSPTYSECVCIGPECLAPTSAAINGCDYLLHTGAETTGSVDIVCPAGKEITFSSPKCTLHLKPQTSVGTATYKNIGSGTTRELEIALSLGGIQYSHTEGLGAGRCFSGTGSSGSLTGSVSLTAEGENTTSPGHVGAFTGGTSEFQFEKSPLIWTGFQPNPSTFKTTAGTADCSYPKFAGDNRLYGRCLGDNYALL